MISFKHLLITSFVLSYSTFSMNAMNLNNNKQETRLVQYGQSNKITTKITTFIDFNDNTRITIQKQKLFNHVTKAIRACDKLKTLNVNCDTISHFVREYFNTLSYELNPKNNNLSNKTVEGSEQITIILFNKFTSWLKNKRAKE